MISHVSPMAQAMFGKSVSDSFVLNDREWEITAINTAP
jgi:transcription elongation GreA/GreB family factor